jgi:protein-S-isoprenylcysteine O-methyltransferase Ste14
LLRLLRLQPELIAERAKGPLHEGQPLTDRLLLGGFMASLAALIAFAGADAWRLRLMRGLPGWTRPVGLVVFVAGWWVVYRALRANAFAVTVVRVQDERGHRVVRTGPYAVVRHPMYAGALPLLIGTPLALGSWWGLGALIFFIPALIWRLLDEESFLHRNLPGYTEYTRKVRYRLVPFVW